MLIKQNITLIVQMITYNHEPYIRQAIESVLAQQTTFDFVLYLYDDRSTDSTISICKEYSDKFPTKIRLNSNVRNLGASANAKIIHEASSLSGAKYIAACEGDDYWCDPLKLQKQIDFLELNPEYSICFHRVYEKTEEKVILSSHNPDTDQTYSIIDLSERNLIHTPSVVFRNNLDKLPSWFFESPALDYPLHIINATYGLIKYFAAPMSVYRIHGNGMWSMRPRIETLTGWYKVLTLLINHDFDQDVIDRLRAQRNKTAASIIGIIVSEDNAAEKWISETILSDASLAREWLLYHYPTYIRNIEGSKRYKLAMKLSNLKNRFWKG